VDSDGAGVVELGSSAGLSPNALTQDGAICGGSSNWEGNFFHGNVATQHDVLPAPDRAHPAGPEPLVQSVPIRNDAFDAVQAAGHLPRLRPSCSNPPRQKLALKEV